jgi:hypothetical protein
MSDNARLSTLEQFDLHWQMTSFKRFAMKGLLEILEPVCSLEIGSYQGESYSGVIAVFGICEVGGHRS